MVRADDERPVARAGARGPVTRKPDSEPRATSASAGSARRARTRADRLRSRRGCRRVAGSAGSASSVSHGSSPSLGAPASRARCGGRRREHGVDELAHGEDRRARRRPATRVPRRCSSAVSSSTRSIESRPRSSSRLASGTHVGSVETRGDRRAAPPRAPARRARRVRSSVDRPVRRRRARRALAQPPLDSRAAESCRSSCAAAARARCRS